MMTRVLRCLGLACVLSLLVGCGPEMAPVRGKVTARGNPVAGGTIVFAPVDSEQDLPNSAGIVQPDGSFELPDGAVVGEHMVTVVIDRNLGNAGQEEDEEADEDESIGAVLNSWTAQATVASGDNDLAIDLTPQQVRGRMVYEEEDDD